MSLVDFLWHPCSNIKLKIISWVDNSWFSVISLFLNVNMFSYCMSHYVTIIIFFSQKGVWYERFRNSFGQFRFTIQLMDIYFTSLWCSRWDGVYYVIKFQFACGLLDSFQQYLHHSFLEINIICGKQNFCPIRKKFCHFSWVVFFSFGTLDPYGPIYEIWFIEVYWSREKQSISPHTIKIMLMDVTNIY